MAIKFEKGAGAPVKLNLDVMDNIASGALFQLGGLQVGKFQNEIVRWGRGTGALKQSLFYFVGEGDNVGAGRFSRGMAVQVRDWVQQAILYPSARKKNVAAGFFGPARLQTDYIKWLGEIGKGSQPTFYLMGSVAESFNVMNAYAGGLTLGISSKMTVRPPVVGKVPLQFEDYRVKVADYAEVVHQGSGKKMPPRPIIAGAIVGWLEKALPEWATAVRKMMWNVYELGMDEHNYTGVNVLDSATSTEQEVSPGVTVVDIVSIQAKVPGPAITYERLETCRTKLEALRDFMASSDISDVSPQFLKYSLKVIRELGAKLNVDSKKMVEFENAILSGRKIKWD